MKKILTLILILSSVVGYSQSLYVPSNPDSILVPVNVSNTVRKSYVRDLLIKKLDVSKWVTDSTYFRTLIASSGVSSFNGRTGAVTPGSSDYTFSQIASKPTTISGYGITDAFTQTLADARYSVLSHTHTFASLTSKPTTLSGYGITDAQGTVTLTTSGTSGAATFVGGTLNIPQYAAGGGGDASTNTSSSVDGEVTLFSGTAGKTLKRATGTGMPKLTSGVLSIATSGTDYSAGTSSLATGILKSTTSTGGLTIAVAGDFPTLNQNTTGSAATITTTLSGALGGTGVSNSGKTITLGGNLTTSGANATTLTTTGTTNVTVPVSGTLATTQNINDSLTANAFTLRNSLTSGDSIMYLSGTNKAIMKRIIAGSNITVTPSDTSVSISATGGAGGTLQQALTAGATLTTTNTITNTGQTLSFTGGTIKYNGLLDRPSGGSWTIMVHEGLDSSLKQANPSSLAAQGGYALTGTSLGQFAATSSASLAGVLSDETGTGKAVFATSPDFTTSATIGGVTIPTVTSIRDSLTANQFTIRNITGAGFSIMKIITPNVAVGLKKIAPTSPIVVDTTTTDSTVGLSLSNIPVTLLNSGSSASSSTFWRGDGTWATPPGAGDMTLAGAQTVTGLKTFTANNKFTGVDTFSNPGAEAIIMNGDILPKTNYQNSIGYNYQQFHAIYAEGGHFSAGVYGSYYIPDASDDIRFYRSGGGTQTAGISGSTGRMTVQPAGGTYTDRPSAAVSVNSTTMGFLPPRMTSTQRLAISSPDSGLIVYDKTAAKLFTYNVATSTWDTLSTSSASGSGTVTSVAMTMPGVIFSSSVSGSPITTSGTFAPALATQTANTALMGPTSGSAATPTFRAIAATDMPSLLARNINRYEYFTDFLGLPATSASGIGSTFDLIHFASGSGAGISQQVSDVTNRPGLIRSSTGTTATGSTTMFMGIAGQQGIRLTGGQWVFETSINLAALSTSSQRYQYVVGFIGTTALNQADAVYFLYDEGGVSTGSAASANWQCVTSTSSTRTFNTTSTAVAAAAWTKLKIIVNAAGTSVGYYVNDVLVQTTTTNIPGSNRALGYGTTIIKSIGTTATTYDIDYLSCEADFTTPR